ncbi:MAG: iron ABC transporter permease [Caldiserica bacterium]|nr:iron ABC transporter permease [Caldisericota bacterium]
MKRVRFLPTLLLMWVGVLAVLLASLCLGRYPIAPKTVLQVLLSRLAPILRTWDPTVETVVWQVRLPRALAAALVGAALASGGAVFQGLFHNPLVSPYVLGVSSGAGFGAAVAILLGAGAAVTQASAFATGALAVSLAWLIARSGRDRSHVTLVLAGFVVGSLFSSLVAGAQYVADPSTKLPQIVFWLMGSLASAQWSDLLRAVVVIVPCLLAITVLRWKLNILSMGDDEARSLGENPTAMRVVLIGLTTMTTAVSVALSGVIGWVGLVVPHLARGIVGPDSRKLIPASIALGAIYVMIIDDVARSLTMAEIPLGILTGIVGAPVFALLLRRSRSDWD